MLLFTVIFLRIINTVAYLYVCFAFAASPLVQEGEGGGMYLTGWLFFTIPFFIFDLILHHAGRSLLSPYRPDTGGSGFVIASKVPASSDVKIYCGGGGGGSSNQDRVAIIDVLATPSQPNSKKVKEC